MTMMTINPTSVLPDLRRTLADAPVLAGAGILLLLLALPTLAAMSLDTRLFQGENVWIKPLKFELALALHLLSLAWFARYLPEGFTARRGHRFYVGVVVFAVFAEIAWIGGAAMYGTASHFNFGDPAMAAIYGLMGVFAVTLTSPAIVYGVAILRRPDKTNFEFASGIALCLTFVLTVTVAGYLSNAGSHLVGTPGPADARLWLLGWSREVGDIRVAHFLATHAMQILPIGAAILALILKPTQVRPAFLIATTAYIGLVGFVFLEAVGGIPLLPVR